MDGDFIQGNQLGTTSKLLSILANKFFFIGNNLSLQRARWDNTSLFQISKSSAAKKVRHLSIVRMLVTQELKLLKKEPVGEMFRVTNSRKKWTHLDGQLSVGEEGALRQVDGLGKYGLLLELDITKVMQDPAGTGAQVARAHGQS